MTATAPKDKKKILLKVLRLRQPVARVCREAGISRKTFYQWKNRLAGHKSVRLSDLEPRYAKGINHYRYSRPIDKSRIRLTPQTKLLLASRLHEKLDSAASMSRTYHVSRKTIYSWLAKLNTAPAGTELSVLQNRIGKGDNHYRSLSPAIINRILKVVSKHPEYSIPKIVQELADYKGEKTVAEHGVQNLLSRMHLNTIDKRRQYSSTNQPVSLTTSAAGVYNRVRSVFDVFLPGVAPAPPPAKPYFKKFVFISFSSSFFTFLTSNVLLYWADFLNSREPIQQIGMFLAFLALAVGMFFFAYSAKYYISLVVTLSFSRHAMEGDRIQGIQGSFGKSGWFMQLLRKIFGLSPYIKGKKTPSAGLTPDAANVKISRYPFISVHLPIFNEKNVAKRLISAAMNFKYPALSAGRPFFEVIVCDDSNDDTSQMVVDYAKTFGTPSVWEGARGETITTVSSPNWPTLKVIHRPNREGFKGGALSLALHHMDPKTEFVSVFDADFVPYPDSLTQFIKYFKVTEGYKESQDYRGDMRALGVMGERNLGELRQKSPVAVVAGYQWHVLNKSENWITRGVRTEYAGSYVVERPSQEIMGAMKLIHGSVYCIRADILKAFDWGYSITEDLELTLRIYREGFKVVYTPYIQAPSECVSTIRRLIRQRMRWAEGHSFNIRKHFRELMFGKWVEDEGVNKVWVPSPLTRTEKIEFLFLSPYYLQSAFFLVGTFAWLISETVFGTHLPFWTAVWGWSLVLTNFFSLPLVNSVGLFMEEAEEKDYVGILSFIVLSYLLVPFQAYAAIKGFIEKEEGPWFRTPKTGRITDILQRGRFYRWIQGILPGKVSVGFSMNPYLALATANQRFNKFSLKPKRLRKFGLSVTLLFILLSTIITSLAGPLIQVWANPDDFYFRNTSADYLTDTATAGKKKMTTLTLGTTTQPYQLSTTNTTFYVLTDNMNKRWSVDQQLSNSGGTQEQRNLDMATDSSGNTYTVWEDERNASGIGTWAQTSFINNGRMEHTATLLPSGKVMIAGGRNSSNITLSTAELYDPTTATFTVTANNMASSRWVHSATLLPNGKVLIAGGKRAVADGDALSIAELYDPTANTFTLTGNMNSTRIDFTATLLPSGKVLFTGGWTSSAETFDPLTGTFTATGSMGSVRIDHTATLLNNGKVLVAGGELSDETTFLSSAELFDPVTGTFTPTVNSLSNIRMQHTATLLASGKVLIAGGMNTARLSTSELFDPAGNTFSLVGNMRNERRYHTSTLLNNGKVLIAGGEYSGDIWSVCETFDPLANTFTSTGSMTSIHYFQTATLLNNGKVLVAGGGYVAAYSTAELYTPKTADIYSQKYDKNGTSQWGGDIKVNSDDGNRGTTAPNPSNYDHLNPKVKLDSTNNPIITWQQATNSVYGDDIWSQKLLAADGTKQWPDTSGNTNKFTATGNMDSLRSSATATLLTSGKVLVTGGTDGTLNFSTALLFDPSSGTYTQTAGKIPARAVLHTATLLNNGKVLLSAGGYAGSASETYDPSSDTFTFTGALAEDRANHMATLLPNGKVLITGGNNSSSAWPSKSTAELYDPSTGTYAYTTGPMGISRASHTSTLLANGKVLITGGADASATTATSQAQLYDPTANTFANTGNMNGSHSFHTATLLNNGKVLITGGRNGSIFQNSTAELYDPGSGTFTMTAGLMVNGRSQQSAVLISNGKVLITGGKTDTGYLSTAELYDPGANTFTLTANILSTLWTRHQSLLLNNGKVLITGGRTGGTDATSLSISELYIPVSDMSVSNDGSPVNGSGLPSPEYPDHKGILGEQRNPTLALDTSNNVFVAWEDDRYSAIQDWGVSQSMYSAGNEWYQTNVNLGANGTCNGGSSTLNSCGAPAAINSQPVRIMGQKLNSSGVKQWGNSLAGTNLNNPEDLGLSATGDINGKPNIVVDSSANPIVTWESNAGTSGINSREYNIYSQKFNTSGVSQWGGTFSLTNNMTTVGYANCAALLPSGKVLFAGHHDASDLYDPSTNTFIASGNMTQARFSPSCVLLSNGKVLVAGGVTPGPASTADLFDPAAGTFAATGNMTAGRYGASATLLANGKVLLAGGYTNIGVSTAQLYDPATGTFAATGSMRNIRSSNSHTATLLNNGKVLVAGGWNAARNVSEAELFNPVTATFEITGNMTVGRFAAAATLLNNGKVLISGGETATADLYDPATGTFTAAGSLGGTLLYHSANLLNNGKVLIAGGQTVDGGTAISTAQLYDPSTNTFTYVNPMNKIRNEHSGTLLPSGKILLAGGSSDDGGTTMLSTAELYSVDQMINTGSDLADQRNPKVDKDSDGNLIYAWQGRRGTDGPGGGITEGSGRGGGSWKIFGQKTNNPASGSLTNQWPSGTIGTYTATGNMSEKRSLHTATVLISGKVLVAGGTADDSATVLSTAQLYDPAAGTFTATGNMAGGRRQHTATLLPNGKVLITGGWLTGNPTWIKISTAELYDPSTGIFTQTGNMGNSRSSHTATLLNDGTVLVAGGSLTTAEVYNPSTGTFTITTGKMLINHVGAFASVQLPSGKVLFAGGNDGSNPFYSTAELYDPASGTFTLTGSMNSARAYFNAILLSSGKVLVVGGSYASSVYRSTAELYDPATGIFTYTKTSLSNEIGDYSMVLLPNGKVLLNGGQWSSGRLFNPLDETFTSSGSRVNSTRYNRSVLLVNGKVLDTGGYTGVDVSTAQLYNPAGEMMLSHDNGMAGNQENPSIITSGTTTYAAWEDDRSQVSNTLTNDKNIFMQKFDTNGVPQWPAATSNTNYISPYSVSDIRADTYHGGWGSHFSGKPVIGGVFTDGANTPIIIGWSDNRNSATDQMDIYSQSYNTNEYDIAKTTNWNTYFHHDNGAANATVGVDITEWDGTSIPQSGSTTTQTFTSASTAKEDTLTWTSGGSPAPPTDQIGNLTMRRARTTFTWAGTAAQTLTINSDNQNLNYDSRLAVGSAANSTYYFRGTGTDDIVDSATAARKIMSTAYLGSTTQSFTLDSTNTTFYVLTDNTNKRWTSDTKLNTDGGTQEQRNLDMATDSSGNSYAVWEDERNASGLGTWAATGNLNTSRREYASVLLGNGKVLIAGGVYVSTAELYDPAAGSFSLTTGNMTSPRCIFTASVLQNGKVLLAGGKTSDTDYASTAELYDPVTNTFTATGNMNSIRYQHSSTVLPSGKVLITGGTSDGGNTVSTAELFDPATGTFTLTSGKLNTTKKFSSTALLSNGKVLIAGGFTSIAELYDPVSDSFTPAANFLNYSIDSAGSALLPNGKVIIIGGRHNNGTQYISTAQLYDPATNTFTATGNSMQITRRQPLISSLNNGKVLVTGGYLDSTLTPASTAELYDPSADTFTYIGNMSKARVGIPITLLNNGKILVATGMYLYDYTATSTAEVFTPKTADIYSQKYDKNGTSQWGGDIKVNSDDGNRGTTAPNPSNYDHLNPKVKLDSTNNPIITWQQATNSVYGDDIWSQKLLAADGTKQWPDTSGNTNKFAATGNMNKMRINSIQNATLLPNGKVLMAGSASDYSDVTELYDPISGTFTTTGSMLGGSHSGGTNILLNNDKVLVVGGWGMSTAELYNPSTGTFTNTGNMNNRRSNQQSALLANGKVLVAGGQTTDGTTALSTAELYDPATGTFTASANMSQRRTSFMATLLSNGKVLLTGGWDGSTQISTAELYDPVANTFSTTGNMTSTRDYHTTTLLNNGKVLLTGGWGDPGGSTAEVYDPSTGTFSVTANNMSTKHSGSHIGVLLSNGKVLIAGGQTTGSDAVSVAELYDPSTNTFTVTSSMNNIRNSQSGTLLFNGKILVTGGSPDDGTTTLSTAELYTPAMDMPVSNDGSPVNGSGLPSPEYSDHKGILGEQRNPTLALDTSNNVFFAWEDNRYSQTQNWGVSTSMYSAGNEWYQTNTNLGANGLKNGAIPSILGSPVRIMGQKLNSSGVKQWGNTLAGINQNNPEDLGISATGDVNGKPSIVVDSSGNPIVTWESNGGTSGIDSREYNIYSQKFNTSGVGQWGGSFIPTTGNQPVAIRAQSTALLNNGKVLINGGYNGSVAISNAQIYDPKTSTFTVANSLVLARYHQTSILLSDGRVLVIGGAGSNNAMSTAELFSTGGTWSYTANNLTYQRCNHLAMLLNTGKVLVAGGSCSGGTDEPTSTAQLFNPATNTFETAIQMAAVSPNALAGTALLDGRVLLAGGSPAGNSSTSTAQLFNPATSTFTLTAYMRQPRYGHTATLLPSGKVLFTGGASTSVSLSTAELYDPATGTFTYTSGNMTSIREYHSSSLLNNNKVLLTGGCDNNVCNGVEYSTAEVYDPMTDTFTAVNNILAKRADFASTLLSSGKVLIVGGGMTVTSTAELYSLDQMVNTGTDLADQRNPQVAKDSDGNLVYAWQGRRGSGTSSPDSERGGGSWKIMGQKTNNPASGSLTNAWPDTSANTDKFTATASMNTNRSSGAAILLNNGKVLLVGGYGGTDALSTGIVFDPSAQTYTATANNMNRKRYDLAAALMNNGKVLISGGSANGGFLFSTAELYDSVTNTFTNTGNMNSLRYGHASTILPNGKVLITGGENGAVALSTAELYDPVAGTFSLVGNLSNYRSYHASTLLPNGKVLITGGVWSTAEIFDPATNTFILTGTIDSTRQYHTATLLSNGKVLVAGGVFDSTAQVYDPATGIFSITKGNMIGSRTYHTATLLPNGKVLIAGSYDGSAYLSTANLFDPSTETFTVVSNNLSVARRSQTAVLLNNGKVFIAGGRKNIYLSTAELYTPAGEMMLSHDNGMAGNQENPSIVTSGTTTYAAWEDDRSAVSNTLTSDHNIFMQKYDTNGVPQWPAASSAVGYESPYSVSDIRVDTLSGGWGSQYSGKPVIGGVFSSTNDTGGAITPIVIGWSDNRNSPTDPMDIYAQSYDTQEFDISKNTNWTVYFDHDNGAANATVNVGITEWDGTTYPEKGTTTSQTFTSASIAKEDNLVWTTSGSPAPPSDQIGNISFRRLLVTFTWAGSAAQSLTLYYDNVDKGYDSRLSTGSIVPEKAIYFAITMPLLPPLVNWWKKRRRQKENVII